ncbi:cystathionine beta-synthase-like [Bradysia coprophila]|uniref:cystathionine beta-synthase-like n=1 Tax=Bradysia coprophila TaxID=38358 RepID=UPI00187DAB54|nr:cystathionine beta-synthase-like [Bradysia coprophila]
MEKNLNGTSEKCDEKACRWYAWKEHTHRDYELEKNVFANVLHVIGKTPLIKLNKIPQAEGLQCNVYVKVEFFNPGGSIKDRVALRMIEDAESLGKLTPGCTIIESSSGNTGIGLAMACAVKGYKCVIVMPDKMSEEKVAVIKLFGAKIVLTPTESGSDDPNGLIMVAKRLNQEIPNSVILDQHENSGNPLSHYDGTGEEILYQLDDKVDMVVCGVGTGGSITGISGKVKERCPECIIVGVDAEDSVLSQPEKVKQSDVIFYEVEGIGYDFIPNVFHRHLVDRWIRTNDKMSFQMIRRLIREEGILSGGSSGAVLAGALQSAKDLKTGQNCVVILSDGIRNYMNKFVIDNWLEARMFKEIENKFNHWWWNHTVKDLNVKIPKHVSNDSLVIDALNLLKSECLQHVPIADENGTLDGFLNLKDLTKKVVSQNCPLNQSINMVVFKQFRSAVETTTLGFVARILETDEFVAVLNSENHCIGIVTHIDLLNFIGLSNINKVNVNGNGI